jgi:hypothetical protein
MIVVMKRTLALALIAGALLLGGCGGPHPAQPPAVATTAPATKGRAATAGSTTGRAASTAGSRSASSSSGDVDSLLSDVDKQLSSDNQSPADQD